MGSRRRAREFALQMLYQWDMTGTRAHDVLKNFWVEVTFAEDERAYAERLFLGTSREVQSLDQSVERYSHKWRVTRMPPVDRNILRLAAFEMLHVEDVPVNVSMNEAIELGKHYSTSESGAFINGILDKVAHGLPADVIKRKKDLAHPADLEPLLMADDDD